MEVVWSKKAVSRIKEIWDYYKTKSKNAALMLVNDIDVAGNSLSKFPLMAAIEPSLSEMTKTYRALVVRNNYKIIYFINERNNTVYIVTVWDCRQDNQRLKSELSE
jgi:plasmid stabilization system protein ParE